MRQFVMVGGVGQPVNAIQITEFDRLRLKF